MLRTDCAAESDRNDRPHWRNAASHLWVLVAGGRGFSVLSKVRLADPSADLFCAARRARTAL